MGLVKPGYRNESWMWHDKPASAKLMNNKEQVFTCGIQRLAKLRERRKGSNK